MNKNKRIPKDVILQSCQHKQEELINSFSSRVSEMRDDAYSHTQSASQTEDRAAGKIELLNTLESELAFVQMEMGFLKSLNPSHENTIVEPGAVVVTNQRVFFIAVSSEKVEVDGEIIFGISTRAPIYSAMQNLTKGDKFSFNGIDYKIEDVY